MNFSKMKLFRKKPSPEAVLVQELQLALSSAEEQNLALQRQLQSERDQRTSSQMALSEADHGSKLLQDALNVANAALSSSRVELRAAHTQNQHLFEENMRLLASISERDSRALLLQQKCHDQTESCKMVIEALKTSYGTLKVENGNRLKKIHDLKGQMDQQLVLNATMKQDVKTVEEELQQTTRCLTEERQRNSVLLKKYNLLQTDHSAALGELHQIERKMEVLLSDKHSLKVTFERAAEEAGKIMEVSRKETNALREEFEERHNANQALHRNLQEKEEIIRSLKDKIASLKIEQTVLMEEFGKFRHTTSETISNLKMELTEAQGNLVKTTEEFEDQLLLQKEAERSLKKVEDERDAVKAALKRAAEETEDIREKWKEETNTLRGNLEELDQNLHKSVEVIVDLEETNRAHRRGRLILLERLGEAEKKLEQLEKGKTLGQHSPLKTAEQQRSEQRQAPRENRQRKEEAVEKIEAQMCRLKIQGRKKIEAFHRKQEALKRSAL